MKKLLPLVLLLTLGFLLGIIGFSIWENIPAPVKPVAWSKQAQWIAPQTPTYRFYARHTFNLPGNPANGWLRISADNDFTLYVNGRRVARENSAFNSSLGLHGGVRIPFQDVNDSIRYQNKPAYYLLGSSQDWKLTNYVDLSSFLVSGKNVIAVEIQKGKTNPRVVIEGYVYPVANANPIDLTTGATPWRISNLSETSQLIQWYDVDFPDTNWSEAKVIGAVKETTYSRLSQNLFDRSLKGNWITGAQNSLGEVWLRGIWQIIPTSINRAYIRFAGNGEYSLLINGVLVKNYQTENGNDLHLLEVTKLLQPGNNILAVRLARPLDVALAGDVSFYLDGWTQTKNDEIIEEIVTDSTWTALNKIVPGWEKGAGDSQSVYLKGQTFAQKLSRSFEGDAYLLNYPNYLWKQSIWILGCIVCTVIYALILGFWLGYENNWWDCSIPAAILTPGTLFLIVISLLKHRYAEAEVGLLFAQEHSNLIILFTFASIVILTLLKILPHKYSFNEKIFWFLFGLFACTSLSLVANYSTRNWIIILSIATVAAIILSMLYKRQFTWLKNKYFTSYFTSYEWIFVLLITSIGFIFRAYDLNFINLDTDENTSLDASRGILRTTAPIATSGIWYTRGPFYQYLLALWLRVVGDSIVNARFLSVIFGTATLVVIYLLSRQVTGKIWIALFVTAILAINPWELLYSRYIRFYQMQQFFTIISIWLFIKGFIEQESKRYQYFFFIALTATLLTQEISLTLLPAFFIGFLYFYRPFHLLKDWKIILSAFMTLTIFIFCLAFSSIRLLTPLAAIADSTASYLRLHFSNITAFWANFFIGPDRMQIIYFLLFIIGFFYFIKTLNGKLLFLFGLVISTALVVTILCYDTGERYGYGFYPVFVLLAIYSTIMIAKSLGNFLNEFLPLRTIPLTFAIILLILNTQPARTLAGYQEAINRRNNDIFEYVRTHKQPGEVVISPLPSVAVISLGQLDYFLMGTGYFDAVYWHDSRLIDRWSGAVVVTNLDQMNNVLAQSEAVWIHLEDTREGRFDPDTWHYIESLGKPIIDSYGTRLRLWRPEDGIPEIIPNQGKDLGAY